MTLEREAAPDTAPQAPADRAILLPAGMVGLPQATEFELVSTQASLPLMWLRSLGPEPLSFPVVEPGPLVADYRLELNDADAEFLEITANGEPPLVLTVLTVRSLAPQKVTVNLLGPIVINRRTLIGKQVVLSHSERYSVEHVLIDEIGQPPTPVC